MFALVRVTINLCDHDDVTKRVDVLMTMIERRCIQWASIAVAHSNPFSVGGASDIYSLRAKGHEFSITDSRALTGQAG